MVRTIINYILSNRKFHLVWLSFLTIFLLSSIIGVRIGDKQILKGLKVDNSMEVWYSREDPGMKNYYDFVEMFGSDEFVVIAFKQDDIFKADTLKKIDELTGKLKSFPYVLKVISLTNAEHVKGENDTIRFSELMPEIPEDPETVAAYKKMALRNPMYRNSIISADGKTTAIIMRIERQAKGVNYQRELTDFLNDFLQKQNENGKYRFHVAGITILIGMEDRASTDDAKLEHFLTMLLVYGVLYFIHRRMTYVFITFTVVGISNIMLHGLMPLFGSTFNMISVILAPLIMVIGVADTIHFISEYKEQSKNTGDSTEAVKRTFKLIVIPCLFTSLTTAVGFASMMIASLKAVREFAFYAALGMVITFIVNMVLVSIWLSFLQPGKEKEKNVSAHENKWINAFLDRVAGINRKHVRLNIFIACMVFVVSITGIMRIEVNTHELKYFKKNHPLRVATEFIENNLTGTASLDIKLTGEENAFKKYDNLKKMEELQKAIDQMAYLQSSRSTSIVNMIKELHKVMENGDESFYNIPRNQDYIDDIIFIAEGSDELSTVVDTMDYSVARIHAQLNYVDNKTMKQINNNIENKIYEIFREADVKAEVSGTLPLYINMNDNLIDSQIKGFGLALFSIFIMLSLLVRSVRLGIIAMFPNIIPIFLTFGIMGWLGIHLDMGTVLIASVSIGLAVDDTIHFISRFKYYFDQCGQYEKAIDQTILSIGSPLTITSVILFAGFFVLIVSTFKPMVSFGILTSVTMLSALIGDLFVLPALIKIFRPFGEEKYEMAEKSDEYEYISGWEPVQ